RVRRRAALLLRPRLRRLAGRLRRRVAAHPGAHRPGRGALTGACGVLAPAARGGYTAREEPPRLRRGAVVHELAICQSVVEAVVERTGEARVTVLRLDVGRLSGVVPEALRFCFELVTEGTPLEGAALII